MIFFSLILAQEETGAGEENELRNRLITFGAYAVVMLVVLIWAIFIRKQRNKRRRIHKHRPHNWELSDDTKAHRRHRRHRRQTPELPKNPSRAEAGGMPPRRPDDDSPPSP